MRLALAAVVLIFTAWTAVAQELAEGYVETGRMTVVIEGTELVLIAAEEVASGRSMSSIRAVSGMRTISISAGMLDAAGLPNSPIVSLLIGPFREDLPNKVMFELYSGDGILAANIDTGTRLTLFDATLQEDGLIQFGFEGEVVPTEIYDGIAVPVPGGKPRPVLGSFTGYLKAN